MIIAVVNVLADEFVTYFTVRLWLSLLGCEEREREREREREIEREP